MAVIDENWNYQIENTKSSDEFKFRSNLLHDEIMHLNGFKLQKYDMKDMSSNHDQELKILIEKSRQLRDQIDKKLKELSAKTSQYQNYKQDMKFLSEEIKDTHEAFLMAKKFYKKYLKMYYTNEAKNNKKQNIFIQFFTEAKKDSDSYSVRLSRDTESEQYELLETTPKMKLFEEWKKTLQETNDIPGVLSNIREEFNKTRKNNKSMK